MANSISGDREIKMMQAYWDSMEREFMMKAGQIAIPGEIENNHENSFFSEQIYEQLPFPLSYITDPFKPGREKDMALLTGLVLLSGCFGNVQGVYDGRIVYPMLFVFISAPAAFGKGNVSLIRLILKEVEKKMKKEYDKQFSIYREQMQQYASSKKAKVLDKDQVRTEPIAPKRKKLIVPGNSSSAALLKILNDSDGPLTVFETEADTIGAVLAQDWGNFSDLLRKAFHHEPISSNRKSDPEIIEVLTPKLAVLLTGTPGQVQSIIKSAENGLFSRFIYYTFLQRPKWRDVRPGKKISLNKHFEEVAPGVLQLVEFLEHNATNIHLTEQQWNTLNVWCNDLLKDVSKDLSEEAGSVVLRLGLILFRIAMIFTALRKYEHRITENDIYCSDEDFVVVMQIGHVLYGHSVEMYHHLPKKEAASNKGRNKLFELLPGGEDFARKDAVAIGNNINISPRTVDSYLKQLVGMGLLAQEVNNGPYRKS